MAGSNRRSNYNRDRRDEDRTRVNEEIRVPTVRVVAPDGNHGIYSTEDALAMARKFELDLVEISPTAKPPVCKIIDYSKYRYEQKKKEKEQRKKSQKVTLKAIRFRPQTDDHDFNFKTKHAQEFLQQGNKVKAWVEFRGRAIAYQDQGMDLLRRFILELGDYATIDQAPRMEGRRMTTILAPSKTMPKK
ncbi:MAG: translation initiation factor IF-3 [Rhodothermales bacterium]